MRSTFYYSRLLLGPSSLVRVRLGHNQAIGAIADRQCRLIWLILHQGVRYEERGPVVTQQSRQARTARMIRQLRTLGYRVELENSRSSNPA